MDRSLGLIGGGITPFSKKPYVTLSHHTAPSRNKDLYFPLTNGSSNQPVFHKHAVCIGKRLLYPTHRERNWPYRISPIRPINSMSVVKNSFFLSLLTFSFCLRKLEGLMILQLPSAESYSLASWHSNFKRRNFTENLNIPYPDIGASQLCLTTSRRSAYEMILI